MGPDHRSFILTARLYPSDGESWSRIDAGQASYPDERLALSASGTGLSRISIGKTPQEVLLLSSNAIPGRPPYVTHVLMRSKGGEKYWPGYIGRSAAGVLQSYERGVLFQVVAAEVLDEHNTSIWYLQSG